jgi:hypothetical protein
LKTPITKKSWWSGLRCRLWVQTTATTSLPKKTTTVWQTSRWPCYGWKWHVCAGSPTMRRKMQREKSYIKL